MRFPGGEQTIPLKQVADVIIPAISLEKSVFANTFVMGYQLPTPLPIGLS